MAMLPWCFITRLHTVRMRLPESSLPTFDMENLARAKVHQSFRHKLYLISWTHILGTLDIALTSLQRTALAAEGCTAAGNYQGQQVKRLPASTA